MKDKLIVCQACLSKERKLYSIRKMQDLLTNVNLVDLNLNYEGGLCWECRGIMLKFSSFRKQVELAQSILCQSEKLQDIKSLSSLSISCTESATYSYTSSYYDPLHSETVDTIEFKLEEIKDFKDSSENDTNDFKDNSEKGNDDFKYNSDHEYDAKPEFDMDYIQENGIIKDTVIKKVKKTTEVKFKKRTVNKRKFGNNKLDCDNVKEKFIEVKFTEEEMVKSREEKRNHPNFKKLPFNCDSCVLGFVRKENYDVHMKKKHDKSIGAYSCPVCQVRFTNRPALSKHVKKHYHCYRCKLCVFETTELWTALRHSRSRHSEDSEDCIHCQQCCYVAKSREELSEHTRTQHSLICNECGEKFKEPGTLKRHLRRIHGSNREHKCTLCPRAFRTRGRLESHAASHGPAAAARVAYCSACRVQYKNVYVYRNHLLNSANHSENRYHCEECDKKFVSQVYFKRHYAFYHQKKSSFKCELCDRLFISEWKLRHHRQMQHGVPRPRNHECDQCGKKFYTTSYLKAHQLTHSTQRSFMCADCGDTFKQRPALYTHTRLVHRGFKRQATS